MSLIAYLKPKFWNDVEAGSSGPHKYLFNFRKIWKLTVVLTLAVSLIPLMVIAFIDYRASRKAIESEILLRTARLVSNTRRSVSHFLATRKSALDYVVLNDSFEMLVSPGRLDVILENLKTGLGGFVDIGVIDDDGTQLAYTGPHKLEGKNYHEANWFREVIAKGIYISDVFTGFRHIPHMVIAVKHDKAGGGFYIVRSTLDTERFNDLFSGLEIGGQGDAFVINRSGILQTPSARQGKLLTHINLPVPPYSETSQVYELKPDHQESLIIGYAYIPDTPFIFMVVKQKSLLMETWNRIQMQLASFLMISVISIVIVVLGGITYLVNQIYMVDQRRLMIMHEAEYSNKMASLGRLSAGVAHEINNPLAIINQKAGLIKDIFTFRDIYAQDPKLMGLIDAVLSSVDRCANITHRLLNFARHSDVKTTQIDLGDVIRDVLSFTGKEAEYRCIAVAVNVAGNIPQIESDRGRLQEIFLNLITNAFAAVKDGGRLDITGEMTGDDRVAIHFSDNGHGIPEEYLERVFEPFFSTKTGVGGTGLGLSITYGLAQKLGGRISVTSKVGEGTVFTVNLPLKQQIQAETPDSAGAGECPAPSGNDPIVKDS